MINVHFPSLSLKDSVAILLMFDLDISWIAAYEVGNHHWPRSMLLLPKFRWIIPKYQRNYFSFESVTPSQSNASADQPSACQWWLFIHRETSTGSSLWSPGQQPWQLSPQLTGSSFRLLWAWPCLAIEANIAHQTKQFMTRSNFDLGPPEMPLPSENEKI